MNNIKYSFLMSIYKNENPSFLDAAIKSMLHQTMFPDEIVIVKDGPLGEELNNVINDYVEKYKKTFTIVNLKENLGLGLALNSGLKICRNDLVARMDSDDISRQDRCEKQVNEFIKNNQLSIVGSQIDEFVGNPNEITGTRKVPTKHMEIVKFSKRRNPFNHPTVMYKRKEVLSLGGYRDYRRNQDLDLFIRMIRHGMVTKNIDQSLLLFRANNENLKRRKSFEKCSSYIKIIIDSWRNKHSSFIDVIIVSLSQIIVFYMPLKLLAYLSEKFLREKSSK